MKYVNQPVRKKDAMALVTGQPVYTDDIAPDDCLIVKVLRSPYANAWVEEIRTGTAEQVKTGSNMRASAEYRTLLVKVLTKRAWEAVGGMADED